MHAYRRCELTAVRLGCTTRTPNTLGGSHATPTTTVSKVTISLPPGLLEFADRQAAQLLIGRSEIISRALAQAWAAEEERLAAEGCLCYAQEAGEFAEASARPFAEALAHAS